MRHPAILNLHFCLRESYISDRMSGRQRSAEGRRADADTHLALLGVKIAGNGILGSYKRCYQRVKSKILQKNSYVSSYKRTFVEYTRDSDTKDGSCLRLLSSFFYAVNRNRPDHSRKKKQPLVVDQYAYTSRLPHKNKTGHHVTERSQGVRV